MSSGRGGVLFLFVLKSICASFYKYQITFSTVARTSTIKKGGTVNFQCFSGNGDIITASAAKYAQNREDRPGTQEVLGNNAACERLQALILLLKESIDTLNLEPEKRRDLTADIHTIEAQMTSSQPKTTVLASCLDSIQEILKRKAVSACASKLLLKLEPVYVQITHQR